MTSNKKWLKERKEWNNLLDKAHNVIPIKELRGKQTDLKILDLYLKFQTDKSLKVHNIIISILTGLYVLLTALNIYLILLKK